MKKSFVLFLLLGMLFPAGTIHAESVKFSVSFPKVYEEWMRDAPKHVNHLTINAFAGSVEYAMRVVNAETGQVLPSGSTVPQGTRVKLEFLPESMSWHTSGSIYDTPYAYWTNTLPPAVACTSADMIINQNGKKFNGKLSGKNIYAPVYAKPPVKTVQNTSALGSCSAPADGDTTCTVSSVGTHTITFDYAQSQSYQYARIYNMDVSRDAAPASRWPKVNVCEPIGKLSSIRDFAGGATNEPRSTVTLPHKTIPYTITVEPSDPNNTPPTSPALTTAGACVTGTAHAISMVAKDPEEDQIRYLIDWDNNGSIDQTVPSSGWVNSGTSQTASKIFATAGSKTVQVRTEDKKGAVSAWKAISFTCAQSPDSTTVPLVGDDGTGDGSGGDGSGIIPDAVLDLSAIPSIIRSGKTTQVNWNATNVRADSCTVTAPNGDSWTGATSPVGGETSAPITGQTIYTLSCVDLHGATQTKTEIINILPVETEV